MSLLTILQGSIQLGENYVQSNFENNFYAVPYLLCHDLGLSTGKHVACKQTLGEIPSAVKHQNWDSAPLHKLI
jgi:hypothetical protein